MLAKSTGRYGDQVTLTSSVHNYSEPTILKFSYYIQQIDASTEGTLLVYLLSVQRAPVKQLFTSESQLSNKWQKHELCIPAGTYYVQFIARLGLPFKSDIGLDDVKLTDRRCKTPETDTVTGNSLADESSCQGRRHGFRLGCGNVVGEHSALSAEFFLVMPTLVFGCPSRI